MSIEIQNLTTTRVDEEFVRKVIRTTLRFEQINGNISLGVVFVGRVRMQKLNRERNGENAVTDVLSFQAGKDFVMPKSVGKYLGEIIVCLSAIKEKKFQRELTHVLIHGVLHLLGYEHEQSSEDARMMHAREEEIISASL